MKVTTDELNAAYLKANEYKLDGYPLKSEIFIEVDRNPLTHSNYFDDSSDCVSIFKLRFLFDKSMGAKGAYVLADDVEVIDEDNN